MLPQPIVDLSRELTETKTRMIANEKRMSKVEESVDSIKGKVQLWNGMVLAGLFLLPFYFDLLGR